ncbi:hypothetical protein BDZ89DRAFT_1060808 [Hymenopellis radicata]|nr:hypothetical protein BDZ89DRAFT_1060808 [Hymenopellis radicata]
MSSDEDSDTGAGPSSLRVGKPQKTWKRTPGSCDGCRKKKGDSLTAPDGQCKNCVQSGIPCTHNAPPRKRGKKDLATHVTVLRERVKELEESLAQAHARIRDMDSLASSPSSSGVATSSQDVTEQPPPSDPEHDALVEDMKNFSLVDTKTDRFFGPSSNMHFMYKMMMAKGESGWVANGWNLHPWERDTITHPSFLFPPADLMDNLLDLYFLNVLVYLPLFHEQTFRRDVESGLHHVNDSFARVLLIVCALASHASSDPRVFLDKDGVPQSEHSAGWKWFVQTTMTPRSFFDWPCLYDVQYYCLRAQYTLGTSAPQALWSTTGEAMRCALELGLHRHRPVETPTVQNELRKRAFWTAFVLDRNVGLYHGRPCQLREEDYDVEYPIACDDEYWETGNPKTDFKQPPEKPAKMEAFIAYIKLSHIISFALQTLFGTRKSQEAAGMRGNWIDSNISFLDSMLNAWYGSLPSHLRWDPNMQPGEHFQSSCILYMAYYTIQIHIHRPFIHTNSRLSLPSLAICTNAARSCIRLVNVLLLKGPVLSSIPNFSIFAAGTVIILNMWHTVRIRPGQLPQSKDLEDLHTCIKVLQNGAKRFRMCDRLIINLQDLSAGLPIVDIPSPPSTTLCDFTASSGYLPGSSAPLDLTGYSMLHFPPVESSGYAHVAADLSLFEKEDLSMWMMPPSNTTIPGEDWYGSSSSNWNTDAMAGYYTDSTGFLL